MPVKRREFLKVLGAGTATAAAVGCGTGEVERLIPYLVSPDETVPGVSNYYATTCRECAAACGVLAETRDGRVIKLEGNPQHPLSRGAICARGQSAVQGLYNPDRFRGPMVRRNGTLERVTWEQALQLLAQKLGETRAGGRASSSVFINQHESGSFPGFLDGWLNALGMPPHISFDTQSDFAAIAANRQTYGVSWPRYDFRAARLVVSFGADFLDSWGPSVSQQLDWADARADVARAPRLIYVGPRRSLTGLNADEWIPCKPGSEVAIARMLGGQASVADAANASGVPADQLANLQRDFTSLRPNLALAGGTGPGAMQLALAVNTLNGGNVGTTVNVAEAVTAYDGMDSPAAARAAIERMRAGGVPLLFVRGANPVHAFGRAARVAEAIGKVPFKVSFSSVPDETTELCDLILPDNHSLESWGDAAPVRGTIGLQQPAMEPVFDTRATADVLLELARRSPTTAAQSPEPGYRNWLISRFPGGARGLTAALPAGVTAGTIATGAASTAAVTAVASPSIESTRGDMYLMLYQHPLLGDGRGANKPWLQELPDPVTKICWQTVAEIHPRAAARMGVENGDLLTVATTTGSLTLPALLYLGVRDDTVAIAVGRGREGAGRYAIAGLNALDLLPAAASDASGGIAYASTKARVSKAGGHHELVTTEGSARQHGRGIARAVAAASLGGGHAPAADAADAAEASHGADAGGHHEDGHVVPEMEGMASRDFLPGLRAPVANDAQGDLGDPNSNDKGMYHPDHWSGMAKRRWAMTIDLARCTGCSACVTACYAENNIPTVGAEWQGAKVFPDRTGFGANILRSREMAWIRLERYFEGGLNGESDFETRFIPMLCQHCGNAPCEPVCPVYATYHAPDGLNVQVYNRCVGTRYCSNNCPYKVRYFNWFGYGEPNRPQYAFPEPLNWQLNPDVTVRGKGVMEKCTFCVQRIREAEHRASSEKRPLEADEFTVACAQACPSRAITFGDAADSSWAVTKLIDDERAYHVFEELNTYTAVVYLKKVNHPREGAATAAALPGAPTGAAAAPQAGH
ncbi:MAG: molybdopterin-dependent oxidoreductase [Gemmatimonadaceae bacterium]